MATFEELRRFALTLPFAYEDLHFGGPAFRVNKKKFALLWKETGQTVMKLPQLRQELLFKERPDSFLPVRVGTVFWSIVVIERLTLDELKSITIEAWAAVAPKRNVRAYMSSEYSRQSTPDPSPLLD